MEVIFGILFFFGLAILALVILVLSAIYSRTVAAVIGWAVIAIALVAAQFVLLNFVAGIGSATSGSQAGYGMFSTVGLFCGVSLVIYFVAAISRLKAGKSDDESGPNDVT